MMRFRLKPLGLSWLLVLCLTLVGGDKVLAQGLLGLPAHSAGRSAAKTMSTPAVFPGVSVADGVFNALPTQPSESTSKEVVARTSKRHLEGVGVRSLEPAHTALPNPADGVPQRIEWKLFPAIGGDTDIGYRVGAFLSMARLNPSLPPYRWQAQLLLSLTLKPGPEGVEAPVHEDIMEMDLRQVGPHRLQVQPRLEVTRVINAGYYGLGAGTGVDRGYLEEESSTYDPRHYQFRRTILRARTNLQGPREPGLRWVGGLRIQQVYVQAYAGSQLEADLTAGEEAGSRVWGGSPHLMARLAGGLVWDTRDDEIHPTRGLFLAAAARGARKLSGVEPLAYLGLSAYLRGYRTVGGLIVAGRLLVDQLVGRVPFDELSIGGTFLPVDMLGSARGVRGIPQGRYRGHSKALCSIELRSPFWRFRRARQRFELGGALFVDAGWVSGESAANSDSVESSGDGLRAQSRAPSTGSSMASAGGPLKYGLGISPRLRWGETVVIRFDFAYAPEAAELTPELPIGIYMDLGHTF